MVGSKRGGALEADRRVPGFGHQGRRTAVLDAPEVDRRLRKALHELQLAERNAVLWFGEVHGRKLFRELGFSSIYQYAGEALGFSRPRTAQFLRLCESLEELPALKRSVAAGDVPWTTAREVAKVATSQTEAEWVEVARKESRRRIERRVRMAQTRSRARRRFGGRQLGLGDAEQPPASAGEERRLGARAPAGPPTAQHERGGATDASMGPRDGRPGMSPTHPPGTQTPCRGDAEARAADLALVPVTLSLRFAPEQYARYEAILERLRKRGERSAREELVLAGLELLLVETGAAVSERKAMTDPKNGAAASPRDGAAAYRRDAATVPGAEGAAVPPPHGAAAYRRDAAAVPGAEGAAASPRDGAPVSPRNLGLLSRIPVYQIVVQQCEGCGRAQVQTSRGARPVDAAIAEAMRCDARVLRPGEKNRATIPPGVRREVLARDGHRCRAPGCGSDRFLEVHHIVPREAGGTNRAENLVTLCSACHRLTHSLPRRGRNGNAAADRGG